LKGRSGHAGFAVDRRLLAQEPPFSGELVEQRFGLFEIGGGEAFGDDKSRPWEEAEFALFLGLVDT